MSGRQRAFACLTKPGTTVEVFPASKIKGKTVAEIKKELAVGFDVLGIRYGTFQEAIDDEVKILEAYPSISRSVMPNKNLQQEYTLLPLNLANKEVKWIYLEVSSQPEFDIPKFLVSIEPKDMELKVREFVKMASDILDMENTPIMLTTKSEAIDMELSIAELYEIAKKTQIVYHCNLGDGAVSRIKQMMNIFDEIHSSEIKYLSQLNKIINYWTPELKKKKIFNDFELSLITSEFGSIQNCHKIFLDELNKLIHGNSTQVAGLFVSHASMFDVAVTYIASFAQITEIIEEKVRTNSYKKELQEMAEGQEGKDLLSFLITPVQRIQYYKIFLNNLIKYTPSSHPDAVLLKEAANSIEKMLRKIETEKINIDQMWRLRQLEKRLLNSFKLYIPTRRFVFHTEVLVKGHSENRGSLYIFNDIVLLTKNQTKGVTVLFDSPSDQFHYLMVPDIKTAVIISAVCKSYNQSLLNKRKDYECHFNDENEMKEFFKALVRNQYDMASKYELSIDWALMNTRCLPPVCSNAAVANGSEFIFFGGEKSEKRAPSSQLSAINQFTMEYTEINASTEGRSGHTLNLIGPRLFIVGGRSAKKFLKKILCYDLKTSIWSQPIPNSADTFEPRYGHTSTLCGNVIIVFGGRSKSGKLLDGVTVFYPFDNVFENLNEVSKRPPARYHHSAVMYNNCIVIHGGKGAGNKLLNDLWEFNLEKKTWTEKTSRGEKLVPRKFHTMFLIGATSIIIGGVTTNGEPAKTVALTLDTSISKKVIDIGNVPLALRNFASFSDRSGRIYVYGGSEKKSKAPCHGFYLLKPKEEWLKKIKETQNSSERIYDNNLFNTQPRMKRYFPDKRKTSIILSLFSGADSARSEIESESSEVTQSMSAPVKRTTSNMQAVVEAKSQPEPPQVPIPPIKEEPTPEIPENPPKIEPEVIPNVNEEKIQEEIQEEPQDNITVEDEKAPEDVITQESVEEPVNTVIEEVPEPEIVMDLEEDEPESPEEQVLLEEIPIFKSEVFQSVPKTIVETPKTQESKKAVSSSKPLSQVLRELRG